MNIAKTVLIKYNILYCEYINSLVPFLGDKVKYIKYKHVFGYDDKKLLEYIASLMEDKYLNKDPDFKTYYAYGSERMTGICISDDKL